MKVISAKIDLLTVLLLSFVMVPASHALGQQLGAAAGSLVVEADASVAETLDTVKTKSDSVWFMAGLSLDLTKPQVDPSTEAVFGYSMWAGASWESNLVAFDSHNDRSSGTPEKSRSTFTIGYGKVSREREAFFGAFIGPSMLLDNDPHGGYLPGVTATALVYLTPWVHWGILGIEAFGSYFGHRSFWGVKLSLVEINVLVTSTHS